MSGDPSPVGDPLDLDRIEELARVAGRHMAGLVAPRPPLKVYAADARTLDDFAAFNHAANPRFVLALVALLRAAEAEAARERALADRLAADLAWAEQRIDVLEGGRGPLFQALADWRAARSVAPEGTAP